MMNLTSSTCTLCFGEGSGRARRAGGGASRGMQCRGPDHARMADGARDATRPPAPSGPRARRLERLPLTGPGAAFTEPQGRQGQSFAPQALADLVTSIAAIGQLEPVLAEELPGPGGPSYRLVSGERRLRAMLWGAARMRGNPHFEAIEAIVCPGPLSEPERRDWQLAENLARQDLRPGELGAALLWRRCAMLGERMEAAGYPPPPAVLAIAGPAARYRALEAAARQSRTGAAAPWADVLAAMGI